ncbi:MAG: beta-propeller domain-containing protein [Planctomycetota bacterium]|nr:beta-propeller domain-containing protein [Planctomycetota bacterium]
MIKSRPSHRNLFRKLFVETLQDRRLMAVDMATPAAAEFMLFSESEMTENDIAKTGIVANDIGEIAETKTFSTFRANDASKLSHFQSEAEAIAALKQMALEQWNSPPSYFTLMDSQPLVLNLDRVGDAVISPAAAFSADSRNLQTAGVDEADNAVFSDDGYAFVFRDQTIRIIDINDPKNLKVVSRIELPGLTATMHLVGNKLVVVSHGYAASSVSSFSEPNFYTQLKFFDVSAKDAPANLGGFNIEGGVYVSRVVNGKLVLVQYTQQAIPQPQWVDSNDSAFSGWGGRYETRQEYLARVTPNILESTLLNYQKIGNDGKVLSEGVLGNWRDIAIAGGNQLTKIVTLDLNAESPKLDSMESVLGDWVTNVYVTGNSVYLTHLKGEGSTRIIHLDLGNAATKADATGQSGVVADAFGDVKGTIRNSRFLDEYDGYLRVVTSEDGSNSSGRIRNSANLFVMKVVDGELKTVGSLLDISPGDQAYGAEFEGPRAFITTGFIDPAFLRVSDPLHGIDLSDPTNPKELSDVVIPGITNYVQWVDTNHLLGVGMIEENSQWFTKVSLYDVTDLVKPKTLDVWHGSTPIQPNAFDSINPLDIHYDAQSKTLTVPHAQGLMPTSDVIVLSIDVDADDPLSFLALVGDGSGMGRAVVVGDSLVALTTMYLSTYSIDAPTQVVDRILLSNPLRPDWVQINSAAKKTVIDVLENDSRLVDYKITAIKGDQTNSSNRGTMKILPDQTLEYTSPDSIESEPYWSENFTYEVTTTEGKKFETSLYLWGMWNNPVDPIQGSGSISANAVDDDNNPLDAVAKGDEFWVDIMVQDGRPNGQGVFGAYVDVAFDTNAFEIVGDAEPLSFYKNGISGDKTSSGWKNLGGFSDSPTPIGSSVQSLVRFKLRAKADAAFSMWISASDRSDMLTLYGLELSIPSSNIAFGSLQLPQRVSPSASIGLKAYDTENKPVTSTAKGDEFWVEVIVQDGRQSGQGVYSAYIDLAFDTKAFEIVGESETLERFTNKVSGIKTNDGWKNLGGFRDTTSPVGSGEQSLVRFKLRATEDAILNLTASASSTAGYDLTLYDVDTIIPIESIKSGSLELPITKVTEKVWDYDVNGDGILSPIDSLIVINRLNRESVDAVFSTEILASSSSTRLDVNQDGFISLLDVLTLINRINLENTVPMMNTVESTATETVETKKKK